MTLSAVMSVLVHREPCQEDADDHPGGDQRAATARVRRSAVDGKQQEYEHPRVAWLTEHRRRERRNGDGEHQAEQRERVTGPSSRRRPEGDRHEGGCDPMEFRCFSQRDPD